MFRERPEGACPRCGRMLQPFEAVGHRYAVCPTCWGAWIAEPTLREMWARMAGGAGLPALVPSAEARRGKFCPSCNAPMERVELLVVPLDRCPRHGVWFDQHELEVALAGAALSLDDWFETFVHRLRKMS